MRVVVVGAGATGLGVAWDLVLRGIEVIVIEQGDIAHGTSGRFHGLLHSGARYAVRDAKAAIECFHENGVLRKIAQGSIEPTGGYFVEPRSADPAYGDQWQAAMAGLGIPAQEVSLGELATKIPELARDLRRAFQVPDGVINGFELLFRLRLGIERHGGEVRLNTRLSRVQIGPSGAVVGVDIESRERGREGVACDALVNAAGPFAGRVAELYGDPFSMRLSRGIMLVFAERKADAVVNRLAPPGDGDILVPHHRISIWGTTDEATADPEASPPSLDEAHRLLGLGRDLFSGMEKWRVLRAFAGVRPLYQAHAGGEGRYLTRDFTVLNHSQGQGPDGVISIVGGKWVTYRLMAEQAADQVAHYLHVFARSTTKDTVLPSTLPAKSSKPASAVNLCECEEVSLEDLNRFPGATLSQLRTRTWFSMGPCQGTFCMHRVAATRLGQEDVEVMDDQVKALRAERDRGMTAALWGDNAREWALNRAIVHQVLAE